MITSLVTNLKKSPGARGLNRRPVRLLTCLFAVLSLCLASAASFATTLDDVTYTSLPGDQVEVRLSFSDSLGGEPKSFTIDNPARIAFDFPGIGLNLAEKSKTIGIGSAHSVSAVEADGRTRVVLNLVQMVPYKMAMSGSDVVVTIEGGPASTSSIAAISGPTSGATITNIDFHRGNLGEGQIVVNLSAPNVPINIQQRGNQIIVDFIDTQLPGQLDRRLDVIDFATPVREIDTTSRSGGARMVITPTTELYEHLAYQSDTLFTVELKPLSKAEEEELQRDKFGYTGERLSLNFQNIEVRAVLQLIADFTSLNMVASDSVGGNVTLRLKNVPWDQALDIILKAKGLGMRQNGNVIMVAPQEEIAAREKLELEAQQQIAELAPLHTEFVQVNYAKASDIASLVKADANNLLSERGNVSVDERTNTLLIQETSDKLAEIRKLVSTLDVPVRQVLIESRIVVANEDFSRDLGVRFGLSGIGPSSFSNTGQTTRGIVGGRVPGDVDFGGGTAFSTDGLENYIVDLPIAGPAGALGIAVGKVGSYLLQLELTALQAEGRGEVVSSPRVITANQKEAVIETGTDIPYQESTSSGATSISFKKATLSLRVTPQITPDDRIIMDLSVNKDAVGEVFAGVPSIDTRSITTQVLVENGETVVLGGVYETTNRSDARRVPFFGDLPYVGWLFKSTQIQNDKDELLIFVTPKILKESLALK
jgi:type IV pilus assembly protein PilQ